MYYLYILYSPSSDLYYVGQSNDYHRRIVEHNESDRTTFTSKHRPWRLEAVYECGLERASAVRIERYIKKQKSRALLESLIAQENHIGVLAQLVRVPIDRD